MAQSQELQDKIALLRAAVGNLITSITTELLTGEEFEERFTQRLRFKTVPSGTVLDTTLIRIVPDNGSSNATYTLPPSPKDGQVVEWRPSGTPFSTYSMTFLRNGKTILGVTNDYTIGTDGSCGRLVWSAAENTWNVDDLGQAL